MADITAVTANPLFLGVVFILFVLAIKRLTRILINCVWITVVAVLFPVIASKFLGWAVPVDADSIIFFITLGLGGYFIYLFATSVYKIAAFVEKEAEPLTSFLGRMYRDSMHSFRERAARRRIEEKERHLKKEEERQRKEEKKKQNEEEEHRRLEEAKSRAAELRIREMQKQSKKHPARKDSFEDYVIIEDAEAEEAKAERKEIRNKRKHGSIVEKFREAGD